jgi:pyruvate formate lyase activating enzyme
VEVCPTGAREIIGQILTVRQVMDVILEDTVFYAESGGGVTFSGGEPLAQMNFLIGLLRSCRMHQIHTAVDTCGYASEDDLLHAAELSDLILYDLKSPDNAKHTEWTGVSNASILSNLQVLDRHHENIRIRIPVIPGFNDSMDEMGKMARLIRPLQHVRQIHLLPYHAIGEQKMVRLGRKNRYIDVNALSESVLDHLMQPFRELGLPVRLGGSS